MYNAQYVVLHIIDWQLLFRAKVNPQAAVGDGWANV